MEIGPLEGFSLVFCVLAHEHQEEGIANRLIRLLSLTADEVEARYAKAPANVEERHITSYLSRLAVGEEITELDDKRDVLYAYTWYAVRTGETGSWLLNEDLHKSQLKLSLDQTASIWAEVISKEPDCVSSEFTFA